MPSKENQAALSIELFIQLKNIRISDIASTYHKPMLAIQGRKIYESNEL